MFETCVSDPAPMPSLPALLGNNATSCKFAAYGMVGAHDGVKKWRSSLSVVKSVVRQSDNLRCVIKMIRKSSCRSLHAVKRVDREIRILKRLQHGHSGIIPILDYWQSSEHVLMVFKEYNSDLFRFSDSYKNGMPHEYVPPASTITSPSFPI